MMFFYNESADIQCHCLFRHTMHDIHAEHSDNAVTYVYFWTMKTTKKEEEDGESIWGWELNIT